MRINPFAAFFAGLLILAAQPGRKVKPVVCGQ
jgi:hypothetical protein